MLSVVLLSLSATFASDDVNAEVIAIDDETNIEEPLALDEDTSQASADENDEVLGTSAVVNSSNINDYIDESGKIKETVTADELVFNGTFDNLNLTVNRSITLTGNDAILNNPDIQIYSSNVILKGFTIIQTKGVNSVFVTGADGGDDKYISNVTLSDLKIDFTDDMSGHDSVPVWVLNVRDFNLIDSVINYVGNSVGYVNNAVRISNTYRTEIIGNKINAKIVSLPVGWAEEPAGSGNWTSSPLSEGIVIANSDRVYFENNVVNLTYSNAVGEYDTIYTVDFKNTHNAFISKNEINSTGYNYIYGLIITGENFTISNNKINSIGDYYANGIDIEGPANGKISDNVIDVKAKNSAYGIYSGMNGQNTTVDYFDNEITGEAYNVFGMSLGDVKSFVANVTIMLKGNYTTGLAYRGTNLTLIENRIVLTSSEVGNETVSEGLGVEAVGVKIIKGNVTVFNNTIATSGKGIHIAGNESNVDVEDNFINVVGNPDEDAFAIYVNGAGAVSITGNDVDFQGDTNGTAINNAVFIFNTNNTLITGNKFVLDLASSFVPWVEIPAGSWNYVSFPLSEGIVVEESDGVIFDSNNVTVQYGEIVGDFDTIYSVDFKNSNNAVITNNNITSNGNTYIYGLIISGDKFIIRANTINSTGNYYANGIDIEGPASGVVENNNITVNSKLSAYGIYSGMNGQDVAANYTGNNISGNAYNIFGFSLGDVKSTIVKNNINLEGNYTTGIAYRGVEASIKENHIDLHSSEVGNETVWEGFGVEAVGVKIIKGNATVFNNTIATQGKGIHIAGNESNVDMEENFINVVGNNDKNAFAIYVIDAGEIIINGNEVDYQGDTNGTAINNAVFIYGTDNAIIAKNKFNLDLVSIAVLWLEIPAGSKNYVSLPYSEGIVVEESNMVQFSDNEVNVTCGDVVGVNDNIYAVDFKNSDDAVIINNEITSKGNTYVYGLLVSGKDFRITKNVINTTGNYYANGIDVEGPASGQIYNNTIVAVANTSVYPIYGAMSNGNVSVDIVDNELNGTGFLVYGIQLGGDKVNITGNKINANGNYTVGIGVHVNQVTIDGNDIVSNASNVGNTSDVWDDMGKTSQGIFITSGDAVIQNNNVTTTANNTINAGDNVAVIKNNNLTSNNGTGNSTIKGNNVIDAPLNTTVSGVNMTKVYGANDQYVVTLLDSNGKPVVGKIITATVDGKTLQATTDDAGVARFDIDLAAGTYLVQTSFDGTVAYNGDDINNTIVVAKKPAVLTAHSASVLITAVKSGYNYKIVLKDNSGNALASQSVKVTLNGKTSTLTTNANGEVTYKIAAKAGTYKLTVVFDSNNNYTVAKATPTIKINKQATKLTAKKKTYKAKVKSKKYSVTLKDSKNKAIKKVKVTLKVKGKTYKATTNSKGKATFKIKNLKKKGTYKAKVKFAGNALYKASSKTVKIKVKR